MEWITKQGDTRNGLEATLYPVKGPVEDIDTVSFRMITTGFEPLIDRQVNIFESPVATVVFTEQELSKSGNYLGEFILLYTDGKKETIPNDRYIKITINRNLEV